MEETIAGSRANVNVIYHDVCVSQRLPIYSHFTETFRCLFDILGQFLYAIRLKLETATKRYLLIINIMLFLI